MSHDDDFIGQLEDYLDAFDGVTPLPDRVRDAIHAELPRTRQVRARPGPERMLTMLSRTSAGARWGLVAAAIVVSVVLGAAVLNNNPSGGVGDAPSATPAPTAIPSSAPSSAAAQPPTLAEASYVACDTTDTGKSCLAAGTYQLSGGRGVWPVTVTVDVPAGWFEWEAGSGADAVLVEGGPDTQYAGTGWGILFSSVGDVSHDPCDSTKGVIPAAQVTTPQQLAAAMAAWPRFKATATQPITVDGHSGLKLQMTSTNPSACSATGSLWRTRSGGTLDVYPMIGSTDARAPGTFEIIDTGYGLLVIRTTDFPQTSPAELAGGVVAMNPTRHAADQVELHTILDSIRLTVSPPSP